MAHGFNEITLNTKFISKYAQGSANNWPSLDYSKSLGPEFEKQLTLDFAQKL